MVKLHCLVFRLGGVRRVEGQIKYQLDRTLRASVGHWGKNYAWVNPHYDR